MPPGYLPNMTGEDGMHLYQPSEVEYADQTTLPQGYIHYPMDFQEHYIGSDTTVHPGPYAQPPGLDNSSIAATKKLSNAETPITYNVTRLRNSIYGESVTIVKPLFFWGKIALLSLTANKGEDGFLFFTMRIEYPEVPQVIRSNIDYPELQKQMQEDSEFLTDENGILRTNYELQGSEYSEEKIFKFIKKLSNAHLDIIPYEGLVSNHMEYLLSKILSYSISIVPKEDEKCHQPMLTKESQSINQQMDVCIDDTYLTIKLNQKSGTTFYLNLVGENHHVRSHVYMDKETFDWYFMTFYENECSFQTQKLFCTLKANEEPTGEYLYENFLNRKLFLESCDLKPYHNYDQEFNDNLQKIVQISLRKLKAYFNYSLSETKDLYFCIKLMKQLDCFVLFVFQNDNEAKHIKVNYFYLFNVPGTLLLLVSKGVELGDENLLRHDVTIGFEYFRKTYGINFEKLSFERKKHFFEHIVLRTSINHLRQESHEKSSLGDLQENRVLDASHVILDHHRISEPILLR